MSTPLDTPLKKPLLYTILMREEACTRDQLDAALQEWAQRKRDGQVLPFGQVVISMGFLDDHEMQPYLDLQRKLAFPPGGAKPLGHLLIENAILRPSQVFAALLLQARTGQRLGELLIDEGVLRAPQLEVLLRFQARPIAA